MKKSYLIILMSTILSLLTMGVYAQFSSQNITMLSNWDDTTVPAESFYGIRYNGIWGYAANGYEYAIIGATTGTYIINVTNPAVPVVADFVPGCRVDCIWRELKTYQNYLFMVSDDSPPNCLQVADLSFLPDSVHIVHQDDAIIETVHTIFVEGNYLYGASPRGGAVGNSATMAVYDITNPASPVLKRELNQDDPNVGGAHDMLAVNDTVYVSAGFDGLHIYTYDGVANQFTKLASVTTYPDAGYNHSTALTDDSKTLVVVDEVPTGLAIKNFDVTNFSNITIPAVYRSTPNSTATPHNPFMINGNHCVVAYYQDGVQIFDVSNVAAPVRTGFFDTNPTDGAGLPNPSYSGAWGAYVELPSGIIVSSDMQNGLFVLDASVALGTSNTPQANSSFNVFPNPCRDFTQLHLSGYKQGTIKIMDVAGKVISETIIAENQNVYSIATDKFAKGAYLVELSNANSIIRKKLIKQ
ncbi:MAG: choice-of-anchor B family protein [Bacteroidetes bacterium]|nr:choice-of-anchor B family protein [Bacteroidota bacterium]